MNDVKLLQDIEILQKKISDAELNKAKIEGKMEELLKDLKTKFNLTDISDIKSLIEKYEIEKLKLAESIERKFLKLKEKFGC